MSMAYRVSAAILCWLAAAAWSASDRYTFFVSDLHLGPGKNDGNWSHIEDFRWTPALKDFLDYADKKAAGKADLVMLGDVFELWQSPFMKCSADVTKVGCKDLDCNYPDEDLGCTEQEAIVRVNRVLAQHQDAIDAISGFASAGTNKVIIVPGNHDAALLLDGVRRSVQAAFKDARVELSTQGYWISADKRVYGDHGHQFDDVNRWSAWPDPTIKKGNRRYMRRPWGENMVQRFYNQYEEAFPVIDNLLDEKEGVQFAIDQVGVAPAADAVGRFLRFFLFQQSFGQAAQALDDGKTPWDVEATRKKAPEFFADILLADPGLKEAAQAAIQDHRVRLDVSDMSDEEILRICDQKAALAKENADVARCPQKVEHLGALVHSIMYSPETMRRNYLIDIAKKLYSGDTAPMVYVYGHTHRAVAPQTLKLGELGLGPAETVIVNDGAFQRVASKEQVAASLRKKRASSSSAKFSDLTPDDLPDCHTFVVVDPYNKKPVPKLMHILMRDGESKREVEEGVCPCN